LLLRMLVEQSLFFRLVVANRERCCQPGTMSGADWNVGIRPKGVVPTFQVCAANGPGLNCNVYYGILRNEMKDGKLCTCLGRMVVCNVLELVRQSSVFKYSNSNCSTMKGMVRIN
jgi:hypothetical protein